MSAPHRALDAPAARHAGDRWKLRCPDCGRPAHSEGSEGIITLMRTERLEELSPFLEAYRRIRCAEGWGGDAAYYRGLPFRSGGRHRAVWKMRARSYRAALHAIESRWPDAKRADEHDRRALSVLELGAGNAWFSWRMAVRGHHVLATDISLDDEDGLRALDRYTWPNATPLSRLARVRAEMEELPVEDSQFDLVVANGSLHYAQEVSSAISEAHRVLKSVGLFLVLDSPAYDDHETGRAMVRKRNDHHRRSYGVSCRVATTGFFVASDFRTELEDAGFHVEVRQPFEGVSRRLRRGYCALRHLPPPARFPLFLAEKRG